MSKIMGLGRGLGSLIPAKVAKEAVREENKEVAFTSDVFGAQQIPVDLIESNPFQPRQQFDHEGLDDLIESIKQHGIIQPLILSREGERYQLIAGERRWRAAKIAGFKTVPAIIRDASMQEKLELALIENIQRKDLNAIERALAYRRLIDEFNLTQDQAAKRLGKSRPAVTQTLSFLNLPEIMQRALAEEKISEGHAKILCGIKDMAEQQELFKKILQYNFSVRDTENESSTRNRRKPRESYGLDTEMRRWQDNLQSALSTRVAIKSKGGEGEIAIKFFSKEELEEITKKILAANKNE
ncbi:MAG: ParB/RepB/Spo0J family partition protein [Candidatus Falkowbacteria bacterium]